MRTFAPRTVWKWYWSALAINNRVRQTAATGPETKSYQPFPFGGTVLAWAAPPERQWWTKLQKWSA